MEGLIEGRIVHYVMPNGQHRAAIVAKVWSDSGTSNLQVITDSFNDLPHTPNEREQFENAGLVVDEVRHGHIWKTSIQFSAEARPNTWHWVEKA